MSFYIIIKSFLANCWWSVKLLYICNLIFILFNIQKSIWIYITRYSRVLAYFFNLIKLWTCKCTYIALRFPSNNFVLFLNTFGVERTIAWNRRVRLRIGVSVPGEPHFLVLTRRSWCFAAPPSCNCRRKRSGDYFPCGRSEKFRQKKKIIFCVSLVRSFYHRVTNVTCY